MQKYDFNKVGPLDGCLCITIDNFEVPLNKKAAIQRRSLKPEKIFEKKL